MRAALSTALPGTVLFYDASTPIASLPVTATDPTATTATTARTATTKVAGAPGDHNYTAGFVPTPGTTGLNAGSAAVALRLASRLGAARTAAALTSTRATSANKTATVTTTATMVAFVSHTVGTFAGDPATFVVHANAADGSDPVGTVAFRVSATALGNGTRSSSAPGDYSLTTTAIGEGTHTVTAQLVTADPARYASSSVATDTPFTYSPASTTGPADAQPLQAAAAPGTVTITTPYTQDEPFDLGTLALNDTATLLVATSLFPAAADDPITITIPAPVICGGTPRCPQVTSAGASAPATRAMSSTARTSASSRRRRRIRAGTRSPGRSGCSATPLLTAWPTTTAAVLALRPPTLLPG